jgi:hypothetical protein
MKNTEMRGVGMSMVKNEEDIIEQFVRHNLESKRSTEPQ